MAQLSGLAAGQNAYNDSKRVLPTPNISRPSAYESPDATNTRNQAIDTISQAGPQRSRYVQIVQDLLSRKAAKEGSDIQGRVGDLDQEIGNLTISDVNPKGDFRAQYDILQARRAALRAERDTLLGALETRGVKKAQILQMGKDIFDTEVNSAKDLLDIVDRERNFNLEVKKALLSGQSGSGISAELAYRMDQDKAELADKRLEQYHTEAQNLAQRVKNGATTTDAAIKYLTSNFSDLTPNKDTSLEDDIRNDFDSYLSSTESSYDAALREANAQKAANDIIEPPKGFWEKVFKL